MPCARVAKLFPHVVFIQPQLTRYRMISWKILAIFRSYTDLVD
jgi:nucleotidyltransferase/DNA polymerase involved in DNA repair